MTLPQQEIALRDYVTGTTFVISATTKGIQVTQVGELPAGTQNIGDVNLLNVANSAINPATEEKQDDAITKLTSIDGKDFSTATKQDVLAALIGEVQASPTSNTILDRLKDLLTEISLASGSNTIGEVDFPSEHKTAFGELSIAEPTPVVQLQFPYNINTRILNTNVNNGGTVTFDSDHAKISTSATTYASAMMLSKDFIKYNTGQGGLIRFTALFTTGVSNSKQYIGIGDAADGFFFGYSGTDFGILRRRGGSPEIQTLTITTASGDIDNVTITLAGNTKSVPVIDAGGIKQTTAREIAVANYSNVGNGWNATAVGDTVVFISFDAVNKTGSFTLTDATSAVGAFAETVPGAAPTDTFTAQSSWNGDDIFDGNGSSGITVDPTKGNVYQIKYQWLGYGAIFYFVENPNTGEYVLVHTDRYANANTSPSISNPTLPLCVSVKNTTNNTDMILKTVSMAGFVDGVQKDLGIRNTESKISGNTTTNEIPILTIRNKSVYQGRLNRTRIELIGFGFETDLTSKSATFRVYRNAILTGPPSFTDEDTSTSVVEFDTSATGITGGELLESEVLAKVDTEAIQLRPLEEILRPNEQLTITGQPTASNANNELGVDINWKELF